MEQVCCFKTPVLLILFSTPFIMPLIPKFFYRELAMEDAVLEIHQLEAFDNQGRSFNRDANIIVNDEGYSAKILYEGLRVDSSIYPTVEEALQELSLKLQKKGFTRIRTRLNFREERYFAEREPWTDYPDIP